MGEALTPGEEPKNEESTGVWLGVLNGVAEGVKRVLEVPEPGYDGLVPTDEVLEGDTGLKIIVGVRVDAAVVFAGISTGALGSLGAEGVPPNRRRRIRRNSSAVGCGVEGAEISLCSGAGGSVGAGGAASDTSISEEEVTVGVTALTGSLASTSIETSSSDLFSFVGRDLRIFVIPESIMTTIRLQCTRYASSWTTSRTSKARFTNGDEETKNVSLLASRHSLSKIKPVNKIVALARHMLGKPLQSKPAVGSQESRFKWLVH